MKYYLAKSEPSVYSIDDLERDRKTVWDGVTNPQAVKAIRAMKPGDRVFLYHSGGVSAVVGLANVLVGGARRYEESEIGGRGPGVWRTARSAHDAGGGQAVRQVRRLGSGAAVAAVHHGGAGQVRRVDAGAVSEGGISGPRRPEDVRRYRPAYQPTGLPLFCSSSHFCSGAK